MSYFELPLEVRMDSIHIRLKKYRQRLCLTLQDVATQTGIPASTYKEWENGRQIRGEPYLLLAETFQIPLQELLTGEQSKAQQTLACIERIEKELQTLKKELVSLF